MLANLDLSMDSQEPLILMIPNLISLLEPLDQRSTKLLSRLDKRSESQTLSSKVITLQSKKTLTKSGDFVKSLELINISQWEMMLP